MTFVRSRLPRVMDPTSWGFRRQDFTEQDWLRMSLRLGQLDPEVSSSEDEKGDTRTARVPTRAKPTDMSGDSSQGDSSPGDSSPVSSSIPSPPAEDDVQVAAPPLPPPEI